MSSKDKSIQGGAKVYQESKLRAALALKEKTPRQVCKEIGMSERTFYRKMKSGAWGTNEAKAIIEAVGFSREESCDIFLS